DIGLEHRCVAVHNDLAEILLGEEKIVADPKQVVLALLSERNARFHARMGKEEITASKGRPELVQQRFVLGGQSAGESPRQPQLFGTMGIGARIESIGPQGFETPEMTPIAEY